MNQVSRVYALKISILIYKPQHPHFQLSEELFVHTEHLCPIYLFFLFNQPLLHQVFEFFLNKLTQIINALFSQFLRLQETFSQPMFLNSGYAEGVAIEVWIIFEGHVDRTKD